MVGRKVTRAEAERQVARIIDQLETVRWELLGLALSLPESADEEAEAEAELRRVVECVLDDRIQWALGDLRTVLQGEEEERSEEPA